VTQASDILLFSKGATVNNKNKLSLFSSQTSDGAVLVHVEGELYKPVPARPLQSSSPPVYSTQLKDAPKKCPSPRPKQKVETNHVKEHKSRYICFFKIQYYVSILEIKSIIQLFLLGNVLNFIVKHSCPPLIIIWDCPPPVDICLSWEGAHLGIICVSSPAASSNKEQVTTKDKTQVLFPASPNQTWLLPSLSGWALVALIDI
jgi:hypothetical protein